MTNRITDGLIHKAPDVCGGEACVGNRRMPVWCLVVAKRAGAKDEDLRTRFGCAPLSLEELQAAWMYAREHAREIEDAIHRNERLACDITIAQEFAATRMHRPVAQFFEDGLICKTPGVCGGEACVHNYRITVWALVFDRGMGLTDEEIASRFASPLTLEQVHAAFAYYKAHKDEVDDAIYRNVHADI